LLEYGRTSNVKLIIAVVVVVVVVAVKYGETSNVVAAVGAMEVN